jgi:hypothetical protein
MVLAEARDRPGDTEGAQMEWRAALSAFREFGAARWAERAEHLIAGGPSSRTATRASHGTTAIFRCDGDTRTIQFDELTVLLRDLQGFRYLERLLADPGREFHVLDLVAVERGSLPTGRRGHHSDDAMDRDTGAGLPVLDDEARDAYRRRLAEVDDDIEEATQKNDLGRVELAQRDREYLIRELTAATGLGGRPRSAGGTSERARTSVTRSIRYALGRLAHHQPGLAAHLEQSVNTGTYCVYTPDPRAPIVWDL